MSEFNGHFSLNNGQTKKGSFISFMTCFFLQFFNSHLAYIISRKGVQSCLSLWSFRRRETWFDQAVKFRLSKFFETARIPFSWTGRCPENLAIAELDLFVYSHRCVVIISIAPIWGKRVISTICPRLPFALRKHQQVTPPQINNTKVKFVWNIEFNCVVQ